MKYGIYVGTSKETVKEYGKVIMEVLNCPYADNETKRVALEYLHKGVAVTNATISNNCLYGGEPKAVIPPSPGDIHVTTDQSY